MTKRIKTHVPKNEVGLSVNKYVLTAFTACGRLAYKADMVTRGIYPTCKTCRKIYKNRKKGLSYVG